MKNLGKVIVKYWYVFLILLLMLGSYSTYFRLTFKPGYTGFEAISELASVSKSQAKVVKLLSKDKQEPTPLQKYAYLLFSQESIHLEGISTKDSTFTKIEPRFGEIYSQLTYGDEYPKKFSSFKFGELSYSEFDQIFRYFNSNKYRIDFWSSTHHEAKEIYKRYFQQLDKPELKVKLIHQAGADSSLTLIYKPSSMLYQSNLGGIPSKDLPLLQIVLTKGASLSGLLITILFTTGFIFALLWRAVKVVGKIGLLELAIMVALLFPNLWFNRSLFWSNLLAGAVNQLNLVFLLGLVFVTPRPLSSKRIWKYLLFLLLLVMFWGRSTLLLLYYPIIISILVIFIIQLIRQKGLQRKVMGRWFSLGFLPMLIYYGSIIGIILGAVYILKPITNMFGINLGSGNLRWLFYHGLIFSISLDMFVITLFFMFNILSFAAPIAGLLMGMLEIPIRYYYRIRKWLSGIVIFGAFVSLVIGGVYWNNRVITRDFFVLYFLFSIALLIALLAMRFFRFLDPVHHDERKALRSLLESSFTYQDEAEYFRYYSSFMQKLYPKTRLALVRSDYSLDMDKFILPTPEMLASIPSEGYFNLDLARIDRDPACKAFPEWIPPKRRKHKKNTEIATEDTSQHNEVRLYFPLTDVQNQPTGYLYFGESGKLYWDKENADFIAETVQIFNSFLININLNTSYREEQLNLERERQERIFNEQLAKERELRNQELQDFNRKIMDSINYASLIQRSILPNELVLKSYLKDYFILWKPRDVVGGDYYWFYPIPDQNKYLLAVIDCTGHGVPGAFMTLMTNSILNSIVRDRKIYAPNEIISQLHREVRYTLQQGHSDSMKDGLDISLILVDANKKLISFSGAKHKALFFSKQNGEPEVRVILGHKHSIGGTRESLEPELVDFTYTEGDMIYLLTDGIIDQPVQQENTLKRMFFADWIAMFRDIAALVFSEQANQLDAFIQKQLEAEEQRDDITLMGIKL